MSLILGLQLLEDPAYCVAGARNMKAVLVNLKSSELILSSLWTILIMECKKIKYK